MKDASAYAGLLGRQIVRARGEFQRAGGRVPGGRVEVLWRGEFGMDAKRGTMAGAA
jgi:hypothetical protein